ncbi:MAG: HAMP domain-containing protein [Alphaproteobacteria bacterium]|nr:HAMP domain-containing protein [Alphaproteobacteria bacterium]
MSGSDDRRLRRSDPLGPRSIRFRIAAAFLAALLAMGGAQAFLIAQQGPVNASLQLVAEGYLPLSKQVARLKRDQERVQRDLNRISRELPRPVTGDTSAAEIYTQDLRDNLEIARIITASMGDLPLDAAETALHAKILAYLDTLEELFARYEQQSAAYVAMADEGQLEVAQDRLRRPLRGTAKALSEEFDKLERTLDARITALTRATRAQQARATAIAMGLSATAIAAAVGLLAAAFLALQPIRQLTVEVQRLAAGAVGARVAVRSGDEVGLLATEFNHMAQAIEERDRSLVERAEDLNRLSRYLGSVVDSLDDGLVVVEQGRVSLVNPAAADLWQLRVGAPPPDLLEAALAPGRHRLDGPEGTIHAVRAVPFGEGGVVAVIADVTHQLRAQERLARSERLALIGQMLAQITHEVRNPLNALSLNAELLAEELGQLEPARRAEAGEILATITGEIDRLTAVTAHYLQLARRPPARPAPTDVARVVEEVARLLEPELEEAGVALQVEAGPLEVQLVDGNQLRQALLNVVRNAVEAGARALRLGLHQDATELRVELADDGPGMPAEELAHATDPFFSTKAAGTGLGLAITRQILEDHDGRVELASVPGQGTTVTLVLPRHGPGPADILDDATT